MPNNREQNKVGCGGWTAWGGSGRNAILSTVLDVLLIRYLKEVWEQGLQISGGGTIKGERMASFLEAEAFLVCFGNSKGLVCLGEDW